MNGRTECEDVGRAFLCRRRREEALTFFCPITARAGERLESPYVVSYKGEVGAR